MSFGIIAMKLIDTVPHYLLIQRRDSLAYVEFLRGKYKLDNADYIMILINAMTTDEHKRLISQNFEMLWENLWNSQNTRQYRNEYELARRTFEALKNTGDIYGKLLSKYLDDVTTTWSTPEWGFPKGRRSLHEAELSCAFREFEEETGFPRKVVHILHDVNPICEEYIGTNSIAYKQIYYLGACESVLTANIQPNNRVMRREVGDIGWFTYEEALEKIRPTNKEKRDILLSLHNRFANGFGEKIVNALEWTVRVSGSK